MAPFDENELFPSPTERTILDRMIAEVDRSLLESPTSKGENSQIHIFLADLLMSRGGNTDTLRARDLYKDILESALSEDLRAKAAVGLAELAIGSVSRPDLDDAIRCCQGAWNTLRASPEDFFTNKALVVLAELKMKKGTAEDCAEALEIFNKLIESPYSGRYFKIRSAVGKSEIILYFTPGPPEQRLKELTRCAQLCTEALRFAQARARDYFSIKLKVVLAEILSVLPENDPSRCKELLTKVADSDDAYPDLRARAFFRLATLAESSASLRYLQQIQSLAHVDRYWIEQAENLTLEIQKNL